MELNRKVLLQALQSVSPGLNTSNNMEATFTFAKNMLFAGNDFINISCPLKSCDISGSVRAKELLALITGLEKENLIIETKEKELRITSGKTQAGLLFEKEITPQIKQALKEREQKKRWKELPKDFSKALSFCLFSVGKNIVKPEFMCMHVQKIGLIESCDNFRLSQYKTNAPIEDMLIGAEALDLYKYQPIKYAIDNGWLLFINQEGVIFSCRKQENMIYPDLTKVIPTGKSIPLELPKELESTLNRARAFYTDKENTISVFGVTLTLENKWLIIESKNINGWFKERLRMKNETVNIKFNIGLSFLQDVLKQSNKIKLIKNQLQFTGKNYLHCCSVQIND